MGQELYVFKLDQQLAKDCCSEMLKEKSVHAYRKYLQEQTYDQDLSFDTIFQKVENNIVLIGIEELWSIYHWFDEKVELAYPLLDFQQKEEKRYQDMKQAELELCFEISSKTSMQ